ncbi:uracil-DNA glycosylase [Chitinivibrio alkaliphilus]|nr:uracil-DNA glycosylase [Chitinivibrio alkaliphilus]
MNDAYAQYCQHVREQGLPGEILVPSCLQHAPQKKGTKTRLSREEKRSLFIELFREVAVCQRCPLHTGRHKAVFGAGNVDASVFVIGEAPGFSEDQKGLPFVGKAGELLTKMMQAISLSRHEDLFISNIVKCRPPENRDPATDEAQTCLPYLEKQISIVQPRAILLLGRVAAHTLLQETDSIKSLQNHVFHYKNIPLMVTYHPAALLRNASLKKVPGKPCSDFVPC